MPMSSWLSGYQSVIPSANLSDGLASLVAFSLALLFALLLTPRLIRRMRAGGMTGPDVNKASKTEVAELGGISAIFAFSVSLSLVVGFQKLLGNIAEPPFLAAISVYFMAAMIGLIDDISSLKRRHKALGIAVSALPLMLVHLGPDGIRLPLGIDARFDGEWWYLIYWLIAVHEHERQRSEKHTSELQSQSNLVCRLLLEKKKKKYNASSIDQLTPNKTRNTESVSRFATTTKNYEILTVQS